MMSVLSAWMGLSLTTADVQPGQAANPVPARYARYDAAFSSLCAGPSLWLWCL